MSDTKIFILLFILVISCSACAQKSSFTKLFLLEGTWGMETNRGMLYESWKKLNDSSMIGKSFQVRSTDTIYFEHVDLIRRGSDIMYIPTTENQNHRKPVTFKLIRFEQDTFTFENQAHDFPQRVIYKLPQGESMYARIEGTRNGQDTQSEYFYKKMH